MSFLFSHFTLYNKFDFFVRPIICIIIILLPNISFASPWGVPKGEVKVFIDYINKSSKFAFDDKGKKVKADHKNCETENRKFYCNYSAQKNEGKIFVEIGVTDFLTVLSTAEAGKQNTFNKNVIRQRFSGEIGARLSFKTTNYAMAGEIGYGRNHVSVKNKLSSRSYGGDFLNTSIEFGRDWFFFNSVNTYITFKASYKKSWNDIEGDSIFTQNTIGINLLEHILGWRVLFLNEVFYLSSLERIIENRKEELIYKSSLVIFPKKYLGLELGYKKTLHGRNINSGNAIITKLWLSF